MTTIQPGAVIGGRYELGRVLGAGGMAQVFLARDRLLDREVAVKVLSERYAADPAFVERFRREASAAAGLNHPNIVSVYDRGETDGSYYIVMELLRGPDLKQVIRERGPLPPLEAIDYALQILAALGAAHRRDVVHRDIKPQNVMVGEDGRLKVTDFGIARAGTASGMTEAGSVIGTAQYLSPEQARGEDVTAASDCYAVGIVLYEMLTGRVPFDAEKPIAVAMKQVTEAPVPPRALRPEIPEELEQVVLTALEKRPADRYRTAEDFSRALLRVRESLTGGVPTQVLAASGATRRLPTAATAPLAVRRPPSPDPPRGRRRLPWLIGLLVVLVAAGAATAFVLLANGGGPERVEIPDLANFSEAAARRQLEDLGLRVDRRTRASADVAEGEVIRTDPPAGTMVETGSTVTLVVSTGPDVVTVPDVQNAPLDEARATLRSAGLEVTVTEEASEDVAEGLVIRQSPAARTSAARGSTVALVVSTGPAPVTVPNVQLRSLTEAIAALEAEGLKGRVVEERESHREPNVVIGQNPRPGVEVDAGTTVDLVVSKEPDDVRVPSVIGMAAAQAQRTLEQRGFVVVSEGQAPPAGEPQDTVIGQEPPANTLAAPGSRVTIIVSTGPAPTTAQPPLPTTSVPPPAPPGQGG